jgi:hypothetical protein
MVTLPLKCSEILPVCTRAYYNTFWLYGLQLSTATKAGISWRLWAGMAKENRHQIGTPLSSLLG